MVHEGPLCIMAGWLACLVASFARIVTDWNDYKDSQDTRCSLLHYIITTGSIASNWLICRCGDVRHVRCANSHGADLVPIPRVVILVAGISAAGIRCFVSVPSVWVVFIKPFSLLSSSSHGTLFAPYSTIQCTTYCYLRPFCPFCYSPCLLPPFPLCRPLSHTALSSDRYTRIVCSKYWYRVS